MNEAERAPSPSRFCNILGICNEMAKASAAMLLAPSHRESTASRMMPDTRLSRMPAATRMAARSVGTGGGAGDGT